MICCKKKLGGLFIAFYSIFLYGNSFEDDKLNSNINSIVNNILLQEERVVSLNGSGGFSSVVENSKNELIVGGYGRTICDDNVVDYCTLVSKLTKDGKFDPDFSGDGLILINSNNMGNASPAHIAIDDIDNIYVAYAGLYNFSVRKYNKYGEPVSNFGVNGIFSKDIIQANLRDFIITSDKKLLIVGEGVVSGKANDYDPILVRLSLDGVSDANFGANGITSFSLSSKIDSGISVIEQPDNKYVITGYMDEGASGKLAVVRFNNDGTIDSNFGDLGKINLTFKGSYSKGFDLALQPNGKIIIVGLDGNVLNTRDDIALARINTDGSLDSTFNSIGFNTLNISYDNLDYAWSVILTNNDQIIVSGTTAGGGNSALLAKFNNDGSIDHTFKDSGIMLFNTSSEGSSIGNLITTSNNYIVGVGSYGNRPILIRFSLISENIETINL